MHDPMTRIRRTIQFDDTDRFFDAVRVRLSELEQPFVKYAIQTVPRWDQSSGGKEVEQLTGVLFEFSVFADTATKDEWLELKMPCGEFRGSIDVPPPMTAESNAIVGRLQEKCEELNLELLPIS